MPCCICKAKRQGGQPARLHRLEQARCAVVRNRVRRRLREIYRLNEGRLCRGHDLVVVARSRSVGADYKRLEREFLAACGELGLLREGE